MYFIEHPQLHLANVVLFMIRLEVQGLGRKTIETECHFHYALSKVHTINLYLITVDVNLDHPDKVVFVSFSTAKFLSPSPTPPPELYSLEGVNHVPTFQGWGVLLHKGQFLHSRL